MFSSLREDRRPLASWRIDTGAGCTALGDLVFGIFSDSSWTAFGRLSERSRSYAKVAQKVLELALEFTEQVASALAAEFTGLWQLTLAMQEALEGRSKLDWMKLSLQAPPGF